MSGINRSARSAPLRLAALALVVAPTLLLGACKDEVANAAGGEPVRPVKVVKVAAGHATRAISYSGVVHARVEAPLSFRVGGKIVDRFVDIGQRVEAGARIASLDPADLKLALRSAEASVAAADARRSVAQDALARAKTLFEKGFATKAQLDSATLELDQANAAYDSAVSARNQAKNQEAYTELLADGPGIITDVRADRGQVLAAGTPVVVLARDGEREVAVAVPEQDVRHFAKDEVVEVAFWAEPGLTLAGKVREIAGSADPNSRTFAIRVSIPADPRVRLGMTASVIAEVPVVAAGPAVPLTALAEQAGQPIVWVVDRGTETVSARKVRVASTTTDGVRIAEGLAPGDIVVTAGTQFLSEGKKVRVPEKIAETAALER